jgi:hypothetical protein
VSFTTLAGNKRKYPETISTSSNGEKDLNLIEELKAPKNEYSFQVNNNS